LTFRIIINFQYNLRRYLFYTASVLKLDSIFSKINIYHIAIRIKNLCETILFSFLFLFLLFHYVRVMLTCQLLQHLLKILIIMEIMYFPVLEFFIWEVRVKVWKTLFFFLPLRLFGSNIFVIELYFYFLLLLFFSYKAYKIWKNELLDDRSGKVTILLTF
jgi:hypothetical protein